MVQKLLAVALVVGGANLFFFGRSFPGFGTLGFFLLILLLLICVVVSNFQHKESHRQNLAFVVSFLSLCAVGFSLFRSNEVDQAYLSFLALALGGVATYLFTLTHEEFGSLAEIIAIPKRLLVSWLGSLGMIIGTSPQIVTSIRKMSPKITFSQKLERSTANAILRGGMLTVIVLFVLIGLLSSADPIFGTTISKLFSIKLPNLVFTVPARLTFSLITLAFTAPLAWMSISKRFHSPFQRNTFGTFGLELVMLVGSVSLVLGFFLLIQFRYLFLAVPDITLQNFGIATYSEYVRKGFGELSLVALITYLVIAGSMVVMRQANSYAGLLKKLNLILLGETIIFIFSIFRRVLLYQAEHGLTRVRIYGSVFLVMMIALTIVLILRHISTKWREWYVYELGIVIAAIFLSAFLNVDHAIATLFRPTVNKEIDFVYIARLSPDAVMGWADALESVKRVVANPELTNASQFNEKQARDIVYANYTIYPIANRYEYLVMKYGSKEEKEAFSQDGIIYGGQFSTLDINLGEWRAYQNLRSTISVADLNTLRTQVQAIYNRLNQIQQNQLYDRSYSSPLVR